jgi:hypothetical protein
MHFYVPQLKTCEARRPFGTVRERNNACNCSVSIMALNQNRSNGCCFLQRSAHCSKMHCNQCTSQVMIQKQRRRMREANVLLQQKRCKSTYWTVADTGCRDVRYEIFKMAMVIMVFFWVVKPCGERYCLQNGGTRLRVHSASQPRTTTSTK